MRRGDKSFEVSLDEALLEPYNHFLENSPDWTVTPHQTQLALEAKNRLKAQVDVLIESFQKNPSKEIKKEIQEVSLFIQDLRSVRGVLSSNQVAFLKQVFKA